MECRLCGLPTPHPPIREDGHAFCCYGCSAVFRNFGDCSPGERRVGADQGVAQSPEGAEAFLGIDGMHCASCELLIERLATRVDGILSVSANYATSTAKVLFDPERIDEARLPEVLSRAGYRARSRTADPVAFDEAKSVFRLVLGVALAGVVMMLYVAFYYPINLGLVEPGDLEPIAWLAYSAVPKAIFLFATLQVFYVGAPILRGAWIGARVGLLNMDNLLVIAILAAYGYSLGQLFLGSVDLYFDVAVVIVAVVTIGRFFEQGAKTRATQELSSIIDAWDPIVRVRREGVIEERSLDELVPGDHVIIRPGEPVPVDGTVVEGQGAVDEALMTGEPFPETRGEGERVLGGTTLVEGAIGIRVDANPASRRDHLARVLWNAQSSATGAQNLADRLVRLFVPAVLVLSALVTGAFLFGGAQPGAALMAGLATLIVSCPCSFGLAIPLTTSAAVSTALRNGIIFTSGDTFAKPARIDTVALDKTGTLSTGKMSVVKVVGPPETAAYAAAVERLSSHPIADAIASLGSEHDADRLVPYPGKGAEASVDGRRVVVGSSSLFATLGWEVPEALVSEAAGTVPEEGVVSYVGWDGRVVGAVVTRDRRRADWEDVVDRLRRDRRVVLLTGAEHTGGYDQRVDEAFTGVPPEAKAAVVRRLRSEGRVAMVGDGSNDAPALAAADLGIAFGMPTSLAVEAADVVIPGQRLNTIFFAFELIATTRRRIRQNLGWALSYNAIAIPLAVTGLLNPLFAALAMSASSLLVVWNSSRPIRTTEVGEAQGPVAAGRAGALAVD